ncbi:T3SS effector NleG family protein [Citrobacter braakii]
MERENFSLAAENLTCPITLSIPDKGVFARNVIAVWRLLLI